MDGAEIELLAGGRVSSRLAGDLDRLIEAPVVLRTDIHAPTEHPVLMSRRTDTCRTRQELDDFLITTARELLDGGHRSEDIAFLAHRFVLAEAGVFSRARPGSSHARIDATWGLPDSLFFYPHDTYMADVDRSSVQRRVRCKVDYIDVDELGRWVPRQAGVPWDWKQVLDDETALEIAEASLRLAEALGEELEVMTFVGSDGGKSWTLPWFFKAVEHQRATPVEQSRGFYIGERATIRNASDISALEHRLRADPNRRPVLTLRPEVHLLRDKSFVLEVAALATTHRLPVELEGSVLSHAYYVLDNAGARVRVADPFLRRERRRTFGKLVRDLVPVKIRRHGELADVYQPERSELVPLIKAKLVEEALEHFWAEDMSIALEELADVLELVRAAASVHGSSFAAVERVANKKRRERGGFEGGIVLVETRPEREGLAPEHERRLLVDSPEPRRLSARHRRPVRLPSRRVLLPLVPPDGWTQGEAHVQPLDAADELVITYGADEILIEVRPRRTEGDRRQLKFDL